MTTSELYRVDVPAIVDTATRAAAPHPINVPDDNGTIQALVYTVPDGGDVRTVDVEAAVEKYRDHPRRKKGTVRMHDGDSFVEYFDKHALPHSEVWGDVIGCQIIAVINAHGGTTGDGIEDYAGWSDHRAVYQVHYTPEWKAWTGIDGKMLSQQEFAEHIEDRAVDVAHPTSADVLELVQTFLATTGVEFESSNRLSSGEAKLVYKETTGARAGRSGDMEIPTELTLILRPFEGAEPHQVVARFRYRIVNKELRLGVRLERPEELLRRAFEDVINSVGSRIDVPVFRGTPA